MADGTKLLTIAIPTYNRGSKVLRLLRSLWAQVRADGLERDVDLCVSDNASVDETGLFLDEARAEGIPFIATRQQRNLGFDGNALYLFEQARTPYLWLFGDDDLPLDGALARVVKTLREKQPDLLLFSFQQPPGSPVRAFEHPAVERESRDPAEAIDLAVTTMKVSIYVFRRVTLSIESRSYINQAVGSHWLYLGLVFCVLAQAGTPRVIVFRDHLARSDDEWEEMTGEPPECYRDMHKIFDHPFIRLHRPRLRAEYKEVGYRAAICSSLEAWADSKYRGLAKVRLRNFVRELQWEPRILLRDPKSLAQLLLLKSGCAALYPVYTAAKNKLRRTVAR